MPSRIPVLSRRRTVLAVALAAACLPFAGGGRAQPAKGTAVPPELMYRAAEILFTREQERARAKRTLDIDRSKLAMARRASQLLIEAAPLLVSDAARWSWAVEVETREEPVAYCLPGGKIMLSTALVDRTRLTPGELTVVIAHAIAHALAGHDATEAAARLAEMRESPDPNRRVLQLAEILTKLVLATPHDMATERAVDTLTLEFLARAGADPEPAAEAWRKIARAGGATPPGFLALHPVWTGRIEEIEAQIPAILPLYEQAKAEQAARPRAPPVRTRPRGN
jgi:Zn-dependent protease with chaperone function